MTDQNDAQPGRIARRDFMLASAGAAALAAALGRTGTAVAETGPAAATLAAAVPGKIVVERRDTVLLVGIDRAPARNLLDAPILIGLGKAYYQLEHDDGLRVAVLHGIGPNFSFGVDVPAFVAAQAAGILPPKDPDFINAFGLRPPLRSKPVVVAVQGGTKFGGHELFLAADVRVAASDTVFSQAEVTRGVFPGGGSTIRLTREAGWGNAMLHMLGGEEWGAEEAYRLGLVQAVTPPGKQLDRALEIARKIAAAAPLGVRATLASAHQAISSEDAAVAALQASFGKILQSEDAKEAQKAFKEGRTPIFRGL